MALGFLGGLVEGLIQELNDWGNGKGFSAQDLLISAAGGTVSGLTKGLLNGLVFGRAAQIKSVSRALASFAFGMAGGWSGKLVKDYCKGGSGITLMQMNNGIHAMTVNSLAASIEIGW
jgi:hypothetical protein